MSNFLYNPIFGLFSKFFSLHLNGMTSGCTGVVGGSSAIGNQVASIMFVTAILGYFILYHLIDSPRYHKKQWVWFTGLLLAGINALIAFFWVYGDVRSGNFCSLNPIAVTDVIGFAILNAIWAFLIFAIITFLPFKRKSRNLSNTTLLKP